jgi:hypothetical protein
MKTNLLRTSLLAVVAAAAVYGQSSQILKVMVPFDFIVGSQTLHAGQYWVDQRYTPDAVVINSADHTGGVIVIGPALQSFAAQKDGKLVFDRYGQQVFPGRGLGRGRVWRPDSQNAPGTRTGRPAATS